MSYRDFPHIRKLDECPLCGDNKTPGTVTCWSGPCYSSLVTGIKFVPQRVEYLEWVELQLQFLDDMTYCRIMHIPTVHDVTPGDAIVALGRLLKAVQG